MYTNRAREKRVTFCTHQKKETEGNKNKKKEILKIQPLVLIKNRYLNSYVGDH